MRRPRSTPPRRSFSGSSFGSLVLAVLLVSLAGGSVELAGASVSSGERDVFVPITPCRLVDTRPAPDTVGNRTSPLGPAEIYVQPVRGNVGNCTIPADASTVAANVTAVGPTANSFFTIWPSDVARPLTANLNWVAGAPPTPNKIDVKLAADGSVSVYNLTGSVNLVIDVFGYYADHNHDDLYQPKGNYQPAGNYLTRGPITMGHGLANYQANAGPIPVATVKHFDDATRVESTVGTTFVQADLTGPATIDGTAYRLKSVTWCMGTVIGTSYVTAAALKIGGTAVASDGTDRTSGCSTLTVNPAVTASGSGVLLLLTMAFLSGGDRIDLKDVTSVWEPA